MEKLLNIKFDSDPAFGDNDKYIKTKIEIHENKVNNNFQGKKIPKENTTCKCLSLVMLDCILR